jgi:hypothetical protein
MDTAGNMDTPAIKILCPVFFIVMCRMCFVERLDSVFLKVLHFSGQINVSQPLVGKYTIPLLRTVSQKVTLSLK